MNTQASHAVADNVIHFYHSEAPADDCARMEAIQSFLGEAWGDVQDAMKAAGLASFPLARFFAAAVSNVIPTDMYQARCEQIGGSFQSLHEILNEQAAAMTSPFMAARVRRIAAAFQDLPADASAIVRQEHRVKAEILNALETTGRTAFQNILSAWTAPFSMMCDSFYSAARFFEAPQAAPEAKKPVASHLRLAAVNGQPVFAATEGFRLHYHKN